MTNEEHLMGEFEQALLQINRIKAAEVFEKCYTDEKDFAVIENLTIQVLEKIGEGWENGSISLSQVYMSGVICEELMERYLPEFVVHQKEMPKIAIAVLQDHHALGKRIVCSILRAGGIEVTDFGQGLSVDELVKQTIENEIGILLISTLMLHSALKVKSVQEKLASMGYPVKIIVGGAPFRLDTHLWSRVGADADGKSATNILQVIESLVKGGHVSNELI